MEQTTDARFVSLLTRDTLALVMAGGRGTRLHELCEWRAKPALYFGGKFRIIDFPLSNCVNSGIRRIGVLTQYKAHSLIRHLVQGWSHLRSDLGEFMEILPASQRTSDQWYAGTADAVYQNIDIIRAIEPRFILVLAGDHIYKMDYGPMLAFHTSRDADMTVGCIEVPLEEARAFGVMAIDETDRVVRFEEKPPHPAPIPERPQEALASMGIYVFNTEFLFEELAHDAEREHSSHDFGKDIIPSIIRDMNVYAYRFRDPETGKKAYWRDVGTVDAFWQANIELAGVVPELNLYDRVWPILTQQRQAPPAKFVFNDDGRRGMATDSVVSGGCVISGARIEGSVLFSDVRVNDYSQVVDSVLLPEVEVARRCRLHKVILDRGCELAEGTVIGFDHDEDRKRGFRVTEGGVVLVTRSMLGQHLRRGL
ncbi:MAG: glucose-1-phosphate adenylyltransferase [Gammaproteobacteria bacterium]|nr:glucose-1-phosphate adenylyltransferase [Gammaproteobacteria bacterium]